MIVTTVNGRLDLYGLAIQEGERYWYNSVFYLLGMLGYVANLPLREG
jgi:hypothetical protein